MRILRRILIGPAIVVAVAGLAFWGVGGSTGVVEAMLPAFPEDWPTPREQLTESDRAGRIHFSTSTPFDLDVLLRAPETARPTTGVGTLFVPETASAARPAPAMVVLHGSGGISPGRELEYGRWLAERGIAAFVVDYYAPRGVNEETNYLMRVISVTEFDALTDGYGALRLLSTHPAIDRNRIGLMGFSYGGMATRFAMDERLRERLAPDHPGFAVFVDYYGPCFQNLRTQRTNGAPLLTLRGTEDASNDLAACRQREDELRGVGAQVEAHVYEGAGHAWEIETERRLFAESPYLAGCEMVYDEQGFSSVDGRPIVVVPVETPRAQRITIRMTSGGAINDCVKAGYVIGRDEDTLRKSHAALARFLGDAFDIPMGINPS